MEEKKVKIKKDNSNSKNKNNKIKSYLLSLEKRANKKIYQHYKKIGTTYNYLILDNLLSNGKCHIVALFKEYLIVDDNSEFLRRFYNKKESLPRIKKVSNYYHETSVIFPNYTPLIEAKYIYKNIMRKQKVIDQIQELEDKEREKNHKVKKRKEKDKDLNENVFSDTAYDEILNQSESVLRIVFGIKKNKYILNNLNVEEVDNEFKGIENLIDEISKYENQAQIQNNIINKNKLKLGIPNSKNKKLSIPNIKAIMDYKNKPNPFNTINFRTFSPNSTNYNTINNSTSRNLKVNLTLLNNNSINSNRQINHKSTYSMPKINISPAKDKKIKLLSFNNIENNKNNNNVNKINIKDIEMKTFFMSNIASPSINKKMHKKIRSVLGRNNENELFKTYYKNSNTSGNIEKEKKKLLLKPSELTGRKVKPSLFLQEEFCGFYTERNKK
jgi:hypothetical protein